MRTHAHTQRSGKHPIYKGTRRRKVLGLAVTEVRDAIYFHGDKVSIERFEEEEENEIENGSFHGIFKSFPIPGTEREEGYSNAHPVEVHFRPSSFRFRLTFEREGGGSSKRERERELAAN